MGINAIQTGCNWPSWMKYLFVFYMITMLVLFGDFYRKNYIKKVYKIIIDLFKKLTYIFHRKSYIFHKYTYNLVFVTG